MGRKTELLNWDHEVYATPVADFIENIKHRLAVVNGFTVSNVTLTDGLLTVEVGEYLNRPTGRLLTDGIEVYEETAPKLSPRTLAVFKYTGIGFVKEIYGRATDIGENICSLDEMLDTLA